MRLFNTAGLDRRLMRSLSADEASWIYNGLDCCVTFEVYEALEEELNASPDNVRYTYEMALAKQAPILEMSMRGLRVDEEARQNSVQKLQAVLDELDRKFQRIMVEVFETPINWSSPVQLKTLFYGCLGIKEIRKRNAKGQFVATVDEDALNRLCLHFYAQPLARFILAMRELSKKITTLKTEIDSDGRLRANFNIAGTNTGRLSSSSNDFGTGTNLQNQDNTIRYPYVADARRVLVNIDLEQADARNVGAIIWHLFHESRGTDEAARFLDACESGDLHTRVCSMVWTELDWTGDLKADREVAEQPAYRAMSYRDLAKRLGHGTNYLGTPRTMAKHTHTDSGLIQNFQNRYFAAFPLIQEWHKWVIEQIKTVGYITTLYGRRRHFFGRGDDASTHRKAVAYGPQSMTGHQIDMGLLNLWRHMPEAELLVQVHDSILFQVPWHNHQSYVERALELLRYERDIGGGRSFYVPLEAQVGWNWGKASFDKSGRIVDNPHGLVKWSGPDRRDPPVSKRLKDYL